MTTDDLSLLVAEIRCEHDHLTLQDIERTGNDWTVYLHDAAHPCTFRVHDYQAFQAHAPNLPPAWIVLQTRAAHAGHDFDADADTGTGTGALTLPELAQLLAAEQDADGPSWHLHAIHRTLTTANTPTYRVEVVDPTTAEVRTAPSLAAYHQLCHARTPAVP